MNVLCSLMAWSDVWHGLQL